MLVTLSSWIATLTKRLSRAHEGVGHAGVQRRTERGGIKREQQTWFVNRVRGLVLAYACRGHGSNDDPGDGAPGAPPSTLHGGDPGSGEWHRPTDLNVLRGVLQRHGWQVEKDAQGQLILFPGRVPENQANRPMEETAPPVACAPPACVPLDVSLMRKLLSPSGWRVESDGEGGALLFPAGVAKPEGTEMDRGTKEAVSSSPPPPTGVKVNADVLRDLLSPAGWRIEQEEDGTVVLLPSATTGDTKSPPVASVTSSEAVAIAAVEPLSAAQSEPPTAVAAKPPAASPKKEESLQQSQNIRAQTPEPMPTSIATPATTTVGVRTVVAYPPGVAYGPYQFAYPYGPPVLYRTFPGLPSPPFVPAAANGLHHR